MSGLLLYKNDCFFVARCEIGSVQASGGNHGRIMTRLMNYLQGRAGGHSCIIENYIFFTFFLLPVHQVPMVNERELDFSIAL